MIKKTGVIYNCFHIRLPCNGSAEVVCNIVIKQGIEDYQISTLHINCPTIFSVIIKKCTVVKINVFIGLCINCPAPRIVIRCFSCNQLCKNSAECIQLSNIAYFEICQCEIPKISNTFNCQGTSIAV